MKRGLTFRSQPHFNINNNNMQLICSSYIAVPISYLDYPWRLEACERLYTHRGVEQVTD